MKSRKVIITAVIFVGIVSVLAIFGGVFGEYSDERNELVGFVAEDGTLLDLDGNPIDEQSDFIGESESGEMPNINLDEDDCEDARLRAIREEEELMANPPKFEMSVGKVHEIIYSLNLTNQFRLVFEPGDAQTDDLVGGISIIMLSDSPLDDEVLLDELHQVASSISDYLGISYPKDDINNIMRAVFEGEIGGYGVQSDDNVSFGFGLLGLAHLNRNEYMLSIFVSH